MKKAADANGINYNVPHDADFSNIYIRLRSFEKRMHTDEELLELPEVAPGHIYRDEWLARKSSADKIIAYLKKKKGNLRILEVGCGNGWLAHQFAKNLRAEVTGMDVNLAELQQARNVFSNQKRLRFICADAMHYRFDNEKFDLIIFSASIQYFSSIHNTINKMLGILDQNGEIHISDSCFYSKKNIAAAKRRSAEYFTGMGFKEMTQLYHHHSPNDLEPFNYRILYNPNSVLNRFLHQKNPFYWLVIRK